jgi:BirA family biotin operon repressor/biotin-[acetyl-CoA-carboxylase] ligase
MDELKLRAALPVKGLGEPLHLYDTVGSTNDTCRELAQGGAPAGTLVIADEQRQGRGRGGRRWFTAPGSAIAMSLLLRPELSTKADLGALNMLGALAVVEMLVELGLQASIKWPNDVLLGRGKVAGILTEAAWQGERLEYVVIGIGVNVDPNSLPADHQLDFPAACIAPEVEGKVEREILIPMMLEHVASGLEMLMNHELLTRIENHLAYVGERVQIRGGSGDPAVAKVVGLNADGSLRVRPDSGPERAIESDVHLRPVD